MADAIKNSVRIIAFKENDGWVAHCVEYDICAQGHDLGSVRRNMTAVLKAEYNFTTADGGEPFAGIEPAPSYIEAAYEAAEAALEGELNFRLAA